MTTISSTLEKRISAALADNSISSISVAELINETETAIVAVEAEVKLHRERTLDITADLPTEQQAISDAELHTKRLVGALDRLRGHHDALLQAEISARWNARADALQKARDAAAARFAEFNALATTMAEILTEAASVDHEVRAVNLAKPNTKSRYLYTCELHARGLRSFSQRAPSLAETTVLPGYWPPKMDPSAAIETLMASPAQYYGEDRGERQKKIEAEQVHERQKMAKHFAQLTAEQTQRQDREEREAIARRVAR